jgi:hypothetical protein
MMYLLITPITLMIISFLIRDKDIVEVSRYLSVVLILDILTWLLFQTDFYYIRSALIDILMFVVVFKLDDTKKSLIIGLPCMISFVLNIIEQFSYYQTIFYDFRPYIQFILIQIMLWGLVFNCKWRKYAKQIRRNDSED